MSLWSFNVAVLFDAVDLLGVLVAAILGGVLARAKKFDPVGFVVLGIVSGLGGGVLRDTLLQAGPPVMLTNVAYLVTAIAGAMISFLLPLQGRRTNRFLIIADALAMGCWAAVGTAKAMNHDLAWLPAVLLGVTTAVGGGIIRDILVGRTPVVFERNTLYATCALVGSIEMWWFTAYQLPRWGMAASILTVTGMCILARRQGWRLPESKELQLLAKMRKKAKKKAQSGKTSVAGKTEDF